MNYSTLEESDLVKKLAELAQEQHELEEQGDRIADHLMYLQNNIDMILEEIRTRNKHR